MDPSLGGRIATVAAICFNSVGCVPDSPPEKGWTDGSSPAGSSVAFERCHTEAVAVLEEWRAREDYLEAPPTATGARVLRIPTDEIGTWAVAALRPEVPPQLARVSIDGSLRVDFDDECRVTEQLVVEEAPAPGPAGWFTDADLRSALDHATDRGVVVYVWAPHMPLSVDGYPEIAEAGTRLGLEVIPVRFAQSDWAFAQAEAERVGMPDAGLRELRSVELVLRDAQVHAPAIIVFAEGRISAVLPGYRNADGYERYLRPFLSG